MDKDTRKLSPHFAAWEFACKHCGRLPERGISKDLLERLEALRARVGRPVHVNSGFRCEEYNRQIGGAEESQHVLGRAADIRVDGVDPPALILHAHAVGLRGLGLYNTFVHVDVRPALAAWDERA